MPAQRDRPLPAQLRRFMGTRSGRKVHYGTALAAALDPARLPPPLAGLLAYVSSEPAAESESEPAAGDVAASSS